MLMNSTRAHDHMKQERLAALIATAPENVTYTSGFWSLSQWIRRGPQVYVLYPAPGFGAPCVITSTGALDLVAEQEVWVTDVQRYGFFAIERDPDAALDESEVRLARLLECEDEGDALQALVSVLKRRGLDGARVGLDEIGMSPAYVERLQQTLPTTQFTRAAETFRRIRAVKTNEEVERLRMAAQIAERSISAALAVAKEGATERDLALAFHGATIKERAVPVVGVIGTGPRSALPNAQPSDRALRRGDVIRFDGGGRYKHYRADIARTATLGEPSAKVVRYHHAIRAGLLRAYDVIRPGAKVADIFHDIVETVRREGIPHYKRNHVGHGIGLDGYDAPYLAPTSDEVIEEGTVLCVETPYYELGFGGLQVEDTVVVGRNGLISLMSTSSELRVV